MGFLVSERKKDAKRPVWIAQRVSITLSGSSFPQIHGAIVRVNAFASYSF